MKPILPATLSVSWFNHQIVYIFCCLYSPCSTAGFVIFSANKNNGKQTLPNYRCWFQFGAYLRDLKSPPFHYATVTVGNGKDPNFKHNFGRRPEHRPVMTPNKKTYFQAQPRHVLHFFKLFPRCLFHVFNFHPLCGEDGPNLNNMFQIGWFHYQLEKCFNLFSSGVFKRPTGDAASFNGPHVLGSTTRAAESRHGV